ncbi:MAG: DUF5615 family PIN-like protein [Anaerolineae bacterium]|nr:DUF5615 family PIN-like protein [Anaerolineae bacterium]MDQ7035510.1 DUF5615 family PIN-like protein [Anaerolineae bacterium]
MRFLADENFDGMLFAALLNILPDLDILRAQDTEMLQSSDPELLEWAANEGRILLTHDVQTITRYVYERVKAGLPMPGVIEVRITQSIGISVAELDLLISASTTDEFENQVRYVPLP